MIYIAVQRANLLVVSLCCIHHHPYLFHTIQNKKYNKPCTKKHNLMYPSRQQKKKKNDEAVLSWHRPKSSPSQTPNIEFQPIKTPVDLPPPHHPLLKQAQLILTTLGLAYTVTGVSVLKSANGNFEPDLRVHHRVLHWLVT